MKNMKLIMGLLFIYSCTPAVTNIYPNPNEINTDINLPTYKPSTNLLDIDPDLLDIDPEKNVISMKIINIDGLVISFSNELYKNQKNYQYNALFNESEKFICEVIYDNGTVSKDDVIWSSSSNDLVLVDQTGLVKTVDKKGLAVITASLKYDKNTSLSFDISTNISNDIGSLCDYKRDKFENFYIVPNPQKKVCN